MVKKWHKETLARKTVEALKKNHFQAEYVPSKEEARKRVIELIADSKTVGIGGSVTTAEINILEDLLKIGKEVLNHSLSTLTPEEKMTIRRRQLTCDCFISSTNALTMDGKLVNVDGTGNRVSAMIFGPKKVIIVVGANKIVKDLDAAMERIEMIAAPLNNKRLNFSNPCTQTGVCMDCTGISRICNITTILRKKPSQTDIIVLVVGEELGY